MKDCYKQDEKRPMPEVANAATHVNYAPVISGGARYQHDINFQQENIQVAPGMKSLNFC